MTQRPTAISPPSGACRWIAGDETATVERLTADGTGYGQHVTFRLADVLTLPGGPEDEVDVEGVAAHGESLYLGLGGGDCTAAPQ